ncbi:hypothetical protein BDR07DRAFT_711022 [Suillus spraguei]|nr:hypothetical protein BDR07DRAFT_711022 [Suillus spraguei]
MHDSLSTEITRDGSEMSLTAFNRRVFTTRLLAKCSFTIVGPELQHPTTSFSHLIVYLHIKVRQLYGTVTTSYVCQKGAPDYRRKKCAETILPEGYRLKTIETVDSEQVESHPLFNNRVSHFVTTACLDSDERPTHPNPQNWYFTHNCHA